jgi:hypothetical protein
MRPAPEKDESPIERAARKVAEFRAHNAGVTDDDTQNEFFIPEGDKPEGWTYEWKRQVTAGATDQAYEVQLLRGGWEYVPVSRHPSMMQSGYTGDQITRKGMVLMERPAEITAEVRMAESRKARLQVRVKEEQLSAPPPGQFDRNNKGNDLAKIKKSHSPVDIPD